MVVPANFHQKILDQLFDGVYCIDRKGLITYWNHGAERITGYPAKVVLGRSCSDSLLMHVDQQGNLLCTRACPASQTMADGRDRETEVFLHHADGHRVPVLVRTTPLTDEQGRIVGAVEIFSDNTTSFLAILDPASDHAALQETVSRIQALIAHSAMDVGPHKVRVTLSIGASAARPHDPIDDVVKRSLALAEQSQRAGGNRVTYPG